MLLIFLTLSLIPCLAIFAILRVNVTMAPTTYIGNDSETLVEECDHHWVNDGDGYAHCAYCPAEKTRDCDDDVDREVIFIGIKPK